jgi:hypothetical protein
LFLLLGTANEDEKPKPTETSAEEIATDFARFPTEAPKKYAGTQLRLRGEVEKVEGKSVYLKHDRAAGGVFIIIQTADTPKVKAGEEVRVEGSITAVAGGSIWIKCAELKPGPSSPVRAAPGPEGAWQGAIKVGTTELRLAVHIGKTKGGALTATLDSIDQGRMGLPIDQVTVADGTLVLEMKKAKASFRGKFNTNRTTVEGEWTQNGAVLPLTLKRVERAAELHRPQEPKKPYPYDEKEITYKNTRAKLKFTGTLSVPRAPGPHPALLLLNGSGPQDRDQTLLGHKSFLGSSPTT